MFIQNLNDYFNESPKQMEALVVLASRVTKDNTLFKKGYSLKSILNDKFQDYVKQVNNENTEKVFQDPDI